MTPKSLKFFLVLGGSLALSLAGCLTGTGRSGAGSGAAGSLFSGPIGDGLGATGPASAVGPSSGSGGEDDASGADVSGPAGSQDTVSDTPITVVGSPMGSSQGPHCAPAGTKMFFGDLSLAVTGQSDELGRREILVRGSLWIQFPNENPSPMTQTMVFFENPDDSQQVYGRTLSEFQCFFARLYAPEQATGKIVRLSASTLGCAPENPAASATNSGMMAMAALSLTAAPVTASLDFAIPSETAETALAGCGASDPLQHIRDEALQNAVMMERFGREQDQQDSQNAATLPFGKKAILNHR